MSAIVVLEIKVDPEQVDEAKKFFREVLPDTRGYEGFESLSVLQNDDDPTALFVLEQWASRAHYEAYLAWRTESGVLDQLVKMLTAEPSIRFFNWVGV